MIDFIGIFTETKTEYWTSGKNVKPGWINIQCPFCDDHSNHCGANPQTGAINCWRCGAHPLSELLRKIGTKLPGYYLDKYGDKKLGIKKRQEKKEVSGLCKLPKGEKELNSRARKYLISRGFDPEYLEDIYDIYSVGPVGKNKFRIIAPIDFGGKTISFLGRDYSGKSAQRYRTATPEEEEIHHKDLLYNMDTVCGMDSILVVEGITDVWRIGQGAVATFGTSITSAQVNLLSKISKGLLIYILFDPERAAQEKAKKLKTALELLGGRAVILQLPEGVADPGELSKKEVRALRRMIWK